MDAFIITMALSARAIQHGAHRHDRRGIYRCVLHRFRGRIEIDHSYGLRCRGLCCRFPAQHSWAGRRGRKRPRDGRPTRAVPGVAAQTTPAQTVSWSIPITNGEAGDLRRHRAHCDVTVMPRVLHYQWSNYEEYMYIYCNWHSPNVNISMSNSPQVNIDSGKNKNMQHINECIGLF